MSNELLNNYQNSNKHEPSKLFVIIPAAGNSIRMESAVLKQYLTLLSKPVLAHTIEIFTNIEAVSKIVVALNVQDNYFNTLNIASHAKISTVIGADERAGSVFNAMMSLCQVACSNDWVIVHDGVRPCIRSEEVVNFCQTLWKNDVGGLFAYPVHNTIKRTNHENEVIKTVERSRLWHALTPQMFRFEILYEALKSVQHISHDFTDESSCVEAHGYKPSIIQGSKSNIKITTPEDLKLAEFYIKSKQALPMHSL